MESKQLLISEDKTFDEEDILQHSVFMMCLYNPPPQKIAVRSFVMGFDRKNQGDPVVSTFTRNLTLPFKPNFASVDFSLTGSEYLPPLPFTQTRQGRVVVLCSNLTKSDRMNVIATNRRTVGSSADHLFLVDDIQNQITFDIYQSDFQHPVGTNLENSLQPPNDFDNLLVAIIITFYLF